MIHQRILLAHDDPEIRSSIASVLRRNQFEVEVRESIDSVISFDNCEKPDVVMCRLAWCDDIEKILRETCPKRHTIQFVQLFGPQSAEIVLKAFHRENHDCLQVPASERSILLSISRAIERRNLLAKNLRAQRRLERSNEQLEKSLALLESDAQAGRHMQQNLLPPSPIITPPYYCARKICPSLYLSGDFVNYARALEDYQLFYLLDVSGHGASSAFVTVLVRQLMRRVVRRHVSRYDLEALKLAPEGFMERVNELMAENELDKHLTMFAGSVNLKSNRLRYSVGAQMPMPILITDEGAEFLPGKGRAVGLFPGGEWEVYERKMPEKYILIAFSDGVLEQLPQKTLAEQEAFMLKKLKNCPADIDKVLPRLGIEEVDGLPDDIAVFMFARGHHSKGES
ncbi:MAG: SpoIIE family protein phosphatase [Porticoccaceae bacterium]|nr:SpoIIE family protein phosphatase [Porticoccaceae bacterium]